MITTLQSLEIPFGFTDKETDAICYAIVRFGDGAHPMPDESTLQDFGFRYVLRCTTRLAVSPLHEDEWTEAALAALDKIKNACVLRGGRRG